jgi:hypothetical protein
MNDVLAILPTLNKKELEAVIAVANQLLRGAEGVNDTASPIMALTFEAISGALNSPMKLNMMPANLIRQFEKKLPSLILLFNADFEGWDATKNLQIAFLRYMMILLRVDLENLKINPSPRSMIDNLPRMGEAFDNAFPNYRKSGLGNLIIMKMQRVTRDKASRKNGENSIS